MAAKQDTVIRYQQLDTFHTAPKVHTALQVYTASHMQTAPYVHTGL